MAIPDNDIINRTRRVGGTISDLWLFPELGDESFLAEMREAVETLGAQDEIAKAVGQWDEAKHPRDKDGKFTHYSGLPEEVVQAFEHWEKCNLWRSTLSREEAGRLGAAKRVLNRVMEKHGLTFNDTALAMMNAPTRTIDASSFERERYPDVEKSWDESSHPRRPAGSAQGGEFAPMGGAASGMAVGADTKAHIQVGEDSVWGNEVKAGNQNIRGRIVPPYPIPDSIPPIPKEDAIYMEAGPFGTRHVIDVKARMVYELNPGGNVTPEPAWGNWELRYRTPILSPQETEPLPAKTKGSAAWARESGLTWAKGSTFDREISEGHKAQSSSEMPEPFGVVEKKYITDVASTSIHAAMRQAGRLEEAALQEPFRIPPIDSLRRSGSGTEEGEKLKAKNDQLEHWVNVLQGKSREQALTSINREYERLLHKQNAAYEVCMGKHDALVKEGKEEEALTLIKDYFKNDVIAGKRTALYELRYAVLKDLVDRLVPKDYKNNPDQLRMGRDLTSSVNAEELSKVKSGIDAAGLWLASHLHPVAYNTLTGVQFPHTPKIDIRYSANENDRAFYNVIKQQISLRPDSDWDTVVHEYGHHLDASDNWRMPSYDFMRARALETTVSLNRLSGTKGYRDEEEAHPDRFIDPYVGKEYGNRDNEVTSMGLQRMAVSPESFYNEDREHFLYTIYLMRGGK